MSSIEGVDTGRSLELFRRMDINILGRVENMSYLMCPKCGERVEAYSSGYDDWQVIQELPLLGSIPLGHVYSKPIGAYHPLTQVSLDTSLPGRSSKSPTRSEGWCGRRPLTTRAAHRPASRPRKSPAEWQRDHSGAWNHASPAASRRPYR